MSNSLLGFDTGTFILDTGPTVSSKAMRHYEESARNVKVVVYSGVASFVSAVSAHHILPRVWQARVLCVLAVYWLLFTVWTSFRACAVEVLGPIREQIARQLPGPFAMEAEGFEGLTDEDTSDWEDTEDMSDSSDTRSFDLDTLSETGRTDLSSIPNSTDSISVDLTEYNRAGASDAIDTATIVDDAASSVDISAQHFAQQKTPRWHKGVKLYAPPLERRDQDAKAPKIASTMIQRTEPPRSNPENPVETLAVKLKQPPKRESPYTRILREQMANRNESMPTNHMWEKARQQPADVIILYVVKGFEYEERMLVRMYKTTPFVHLKNELREKDDMISELAIKGSEGDFPVFDNDTPLSVSFSFRSVILAEIMGLNKLILCVYLSKIGLKPLSTSFWTPMPNMPTSLDLTVKSRVECGCSKEGPTFDRYDCQKS